MHDPKTLASQLTGFSSFYRYIFIAKRGQKYRALASYTMIMWNWKSSIGHSHARIILASMNVIIVLFVEVTSRDGIRERDITTM